MKKIYVKTLLIFCFFVSNHLQAQVGIGTTAPTGALDITSTTNGVVISRVALTATNVAAPVVNPQGGLLTAGTLVWNTNTAGISPNQVIPGFYYWNGTIWISVTGASGNPWTLSGNGGTTSGTNYIGTTDAENLQLRTAATERLTVSGTTGNVVIGTPTISLDTRLEVDSGVANDGIYGHSSNVGGVLGREVNFSFGTPAQTLLGAGVYASNPTAGYTSLFGQSTGAATVAAGINFSNVWIGNYNYVENASASYNPASSYSQLNVSNNTLTGTQSALRGYSNRGVTAGNPGITSGVQGTASAQFQDAIGVMGSAFSNSAFTSAGGYFSGSTYASTNYAYAYVGGTINGGVTLRKIVGIGSVSEIIPTETHGRITLTCPESPEYWYQDYGTVQIVNGRATITLDDILADIIVVDDENPIRVICTPVGMPYFNGITILSQTKNSVEILELNGGNHSGKLQYQLVAKPKTNYGEGRFPQAPGPAYLKADKEPMAAKAQNQPNDGRRIYRWPTDQEVYKYNPEDLVAIGDVIPSGIHAGKVKLGNGKYGEGLPAQKPKN
ncbi:MAG: hypothetical protein H7199_12160 [Burkholderiales bacterium]|nr:hypothetical protein [Flavobacterium sp.]